MAAARSRLGMVLGTAILVGLVAAAIGATLGAHRWKQDLHLRAVEVLGNRVVSSEEILQLAALRPDTALFDIDLRAVQLRVASHPYIVRAAVSRNVPDGIIIEVTERRPVAILPAGRLLALDGEGRVLPPAGAEALFDLPVLTGVSAGQLVPGRHLKGADVEQALALIRIAEEAGEELYRRISEVHIRPDGALLVYTTESSVPVLFGSGDLARKLVTFDGFWRAIVSRRGVTELQSVDMRFRDQVVARWQ